MRNLISPSYLPHYTVKKQGGQYRTEKLPEQRFRHKEYPYLDLRLKADASIAFPDRSFDAVILFAVLTCIAKDRVRKLLPGFHTERFSHLELILHTC